MPFIGTRVNIVLDEDKRERLKNRWDQAITLLPGKSPQWLMAGFEDGVSPVLPREITSLRLLLWRSRFLVPWTLQPATG